MTYEKQTWASGDTITAEKLNHMETGIVNASSATLLLYYKDSTLYLDAEYSKVATIDDIQNRVMIGYLWDGGNGAWYINYSDSIRFYDNFTYAQVHIADESAGAVWVFNSEGNSYSPD